MSQVLIVEDEDRIASFIAKGLKAAGIGSSRAGTLAHARELAGSDEFDLVVLDLTLPDGDGMTLIEWLRGSGFEVPIIVLTARTGVDDTVAVLTEGADDYMPKPFRFEELLARVKLRLRQAAAASTPVADSAGRVRLDVRARQVSVDGGSRQDLSAREFALLETLMEHPGQVLSREQLLSRVWGYDFDPGSNVVDVYVRYLRAKLGAEFVVTVRGMGYRFVADPSHGEAPEAPREGGAS